MDAETLLGELIRLNLAASAAVVLVLALREPVMKRLGPRLVYGLWTLVPVVVLAALLPARERIVTAPASAGMAALEPAVLGSGVGSPIVAAPVASTMAPDFSAELVILWLAGAATLLARSVVYTRRAARDPAMGPALVGVFWPRLVLPADFSTRFDAREQALILAHEDVHRRSGHTLVNGCVELARCVCWFNPLAHVAARRLRLDQELACDATVVARHPTERRTYAVALLKTHSVNMPLPLGCAFLPFGCAWTSRAAARLHERIELLAHPQPGRRGMAFGAALIAMLGLCAGYAAWAQQPERIVVEIGTAPAATWTPSSDAPPGTLSHALEGERHDLFIDLARKGDIDFVLFGTTDAEMFWWPDRGRPVWDRAFAGIRAANFGAQGTSPRSLLWRMRNGELDGYRAKLIVLQTGFCMGDGANAGLEGADAAAVYNDCTPIVMEVLKRQPRAKVLLVPPFPRGFVERATWIPIASQNQLAVGQFVDGARVFYADFGERFFLPDGSHNGTMWARPGVAGVGVGAQPAAFEAFAEGLQPWLDRFVR